MKKIFLIGFIASIVSTQVFASFSTTVRDAAPKIRTVKQVNVTPGDTNINVVFFDNAIAYCYYTDMKFCLPLVKMIGKSITTNLMGNAFTYELK